MGKKDKQQNQEIAAVGAWDEAANTTWGENYKNQGAENEDRGGTELERREQYAKDEMVKDLMSNKTGVHRDGPEGDYFLVLVFKNEEDDKYEMYDAAVREYRMEREKIVNAILRLGLQVHRHKSRDGDEKFVKIYAGQDQLERLAEQLEFPVKLKKGGYQEFRREIRGLFQVPKPWEGAGAEAEEPAIDDEGDSGGDFHFSSANGTQIIFEMLEMSTEFGGAGLNLGELMVKEKTFGEGAEECTTAILVDFFPGHREKEVEWLTKYWGSFGLICTAFLSQPLERVKSYFGSQIGLYFTFLGFYTKSLCAPALAGIYAFSIQMAEGHFDVKEAIPFIAAFMSFWGTLMLEGWKRREITCAFRWGTIGFEKTEKPRPEFEGEPRLNPITGEPELWYPEEKRNIKVYGALFVAFFSTLVVGFGIASVLMFRYFMIKNVANEAGALAGIVNGIMIAVFNTLYATLAVYLTDWENHKTQTEYDDSLILKSFMFQFINSYVSFYVVAFVKPFGDYFGVAHLFGQCLCQSFNQNICTNKDIVGPDSPKTPLGSTEPCACTPHGYSCVDELSMLLVSVFGVQLLIGNVMEFGVPLIKAKVAMYLEEREMKAAMAGKKESATTVSDDQIPKLCEAEVEAKMEKYESPFEDYNEMVIQYGFVSLFSAAFPLCALLALLNNIIEIRSDASKLLRCHQRPIPRSAEDIGSWYYIMDIMTYICIITNCALVFFTSGMAENMLPGTRIWGFILAEHIVIIIKVGLAFAIPDTPAKTQEAMERDEYRIKRDADLARFGELADKDDEDIGNTDEPDFFDEDSSAYPDDAWLMT